MATLHFLAAPFAACLVLVGIHSYLGQHVLRRQVIFVDLALAQIAALGSVAAFALGLHPDEAGSSLFSLGFAILGAALFALTRARYEKIPQEAVIGMTFVVASAAAILVADRAPEGAEHIKQTLAGSILWVGWADVGKSAGIYALVGLFHWIYRRQFILISEDPAEAFRRGLRVRLWDFAFYVSFGVVITLSVKMAGILLVFSYLVMPAAMATLIGAGWGGRLAAGYVMGTLGSLLGFVLSYRLDMPSGPAVVCTLALLLAVVAVWNAFTRRHEREGNGRRLASLAVALGLVIAAGALLLIIVLPSPTEEHRAAHHSSAGPDRTSLLTAEEGAMPEERSRASASRDSGRDRDACTPLVVLREGENLASLSQDCYGEDLAGPLRSHNEAIGQLAPGQDPVAGDLIELPPRQELPESGEEDGI